MIPLFKVNMSPEAPARVAEVLASGMVGEGPKVEEFQKSLRGLLGSQFVTCLNSCTSALVLALRIAGVRPGDDVISTPYTFVATNTAIKEVGGNIVWAALQKRTLCADPNSIVRLVQKKKPAAVVVTLVGGGTPSGLDRLQGFLSDENVPLILDCAHALLTTYHGIPICEWADFSCFSFQSIKHLTTGDGGALICSAKEHHDLAERLKWFGMTRSIPEGMSRLEHQMTASITDWGYKFHMNDISAAIGLANIELAKRAVAASRENARFYDDAISSIPSLVRLGDTECDSSYWVYGVGLGDGLNPMHIVNGLSELGIASSPMWPMNSIHACFPDSDEKQPAAVFIPSGFWISESDRLHIVKSLENLSL